MPTGIRQDALFAGNQTAGQQRQYTYNRGHLNGILIMMGTGGNSLENRLTIKRRVGDQVINLLPNVRINDLRRVSAIEYGYDNRSDPWKQLKTLLRAQVPAITDANWASTIEAVCGPTETLFTVFVPLGSIYLGTDSELDITLNVDPALAAPCPFQFYAISSDRVPDYNLTLDYSINLEQWHRGVESLYLVSRDASDLFGRTFTLGAPDLQVLVQDDDRETISDFYGYLAATNALGMVEGRVMGEILRIYQVRDPLPADVFMKVTGSWAQYVTPLVRRKVVSAPTVSANTVREVQSLAQRVEQLERTAPDVARALRHAGEIAKAEDLKAIAAAGAASNAVQAA